MTLVYCIMFGVWFVGLIAYASMDAAFGSYPRAGFLECAFWFVNIFRSKGVP